MGAASYVAVQDDSLCAIVTAVGCGRKFIPLRDGGVYLAHEAAHALGHMATHVNLAIVRPILLDVSRMREEELG